VPHSESLILLNCSRTCTKRRSVACLWADGRHLVDVDPFRTAIRHTNSEAIPLKLTLIGARPTTGLGLLHRFDAESYVLVQIDAHFGGAVDYVFAAHGFRESLIFHLLADTGDFYVGDPLRGFD
jgi:hypothetical protein